MSILLREKNERDRRYLVIANKTGQVGQVRTGLYHNHANVRVMSVMVKMRPNASEPVRTPTPGDHP